MQRRDFGRGGPSLSALTFGCMRMEPDRLSPDAARDLLDSLLDAGVDTFHSSDEYATFPTFCAALAAVRKRRPAARPVHVVKIAAPHFDEPRFDPDRLEARVDAYLRALDTDRLDVVQWLLRATPNTDARRLPLWDEARSALLDRWDAIARKGKVGVLASFPYSPAFAERVVREPGLKGLVTYLSPCELETAPLLDGMQARGQGFVAIRPLFVGRLASSWKDPGTDDAETRAARTARAAWAPPVTNGDLTRAALRFPLMHPAVASVMVSVTTEAHAREAVAAVRDAPVDVDAFRRLAAAVLRPA